MKCIKAMITYHQRCLQNQRDSPFKRQLQYELNFCWCCFTFLSPFINCDSLMLVRQLRYIFAVPFKLCHYRSSWNSPSPRGNVSPWKTDHQSFSASLYRNCSISLQAYIFKEAHFTVSWYDRRGRFPWTLHLYTNMLSTGNFISKILVFLSRIKL